MTSAAAAVVMAGREERAMIQSRLLSGRSDHFVCQVTLNVPGYPKRLLGDETIIEKCRMDFQIGICCESHKEVKLENGAGLALLMLFSGGKEKITAAKQVGIFIEDNACYGRIVDIDVITVDRQLSRRDFHLKPRRCFLCGKDSKECARERKHSYQELRAEVQALIDGNS